MTSRICFFAHYDKDNIIEDYVVYYIEKLKEICDKIVFVSTANHISESEFSKILPHVDHYFTKKNEGYDFGSWKSGMEYIGFENLSQYDEVIVANDSCWGPIHPFPPIFEKMSQKNYYAWSITDNITDIYHMQSYFIVMNSALFQNEWFKQFWQNITVQSNKMEYVAKYEKGFSKLLTDHGKKFGSYHEISKIEIFMFTIINSIRWIYIASFNKYVRKRASEKIEHAASIGGNIKIGQLLSVAKAILASVAKAILGRFTDASLPFLHPMYLIKRMVPFLKIILFRDNPCGVNLERLLKQLEKYIKNNTSYPFELISNRIKKFEK